MINFFTDDNDWDLPKGQCDECKNNDICKWKDEVIKINTIINDIVLIKESPIVMSVECKRFEEKEFLEGIVL